MENNKWKAISISGRLMVSDFGRIDCTHSFDKDYLREDIKEGDFLNTPPNYYGVLVRSIGDEQVEVKIGDQIFLLTPGNTVYPKDCPLSYAWSSLAVTLVPED